MQRSHTWSDMWKMSTLGFQYSHALKADKYADLSMDLETKGYRTDLFPIKVGASGVVGSYNNINYNI